MADFVFKGVIPPVSTIFTADFKFDPQGQARLIDFLIESGVDGLFFLGSGGVISASGNFAPQFTINTYQNFVKGDMAAACRWHQHLLEVTRVYGLDSPFVNCVKEATVLAGVDISTAVLPPTSPLSEEKKAELKALMHELQII